MGSGAGGGVVILLRDDKRFLARLLEPLARDAKGRVMWAYRAAWEAGEAEEAVPHKKENAGRRAANLWIRELMMETPPAVLRYRELIDQGPPRLCHTCDHFDKEDGHCAHFNATPPADFTATENACDQWVIEIPF